MDGHHGGSMGQMVDLQLYISLAVARPCKVHGKEYPCGDGTMLFHSEMACLQLHFTSLATGPISIPTKL